VVSGDARRIVSGVSAFPPSSGRSIEGASLSQRAFGRGGLAGVALLAGAWVGAQDVKLVTIVATINNDKIITIALTNAFFMIIFLSIFDLKGLIIFFSGSFRYRSLVSFQ
jgi:hypothetical protein